MKNFEYTSYLLIYNTMNIVNWFRSYEIISKNLYDVSAVYIILESRFIVFIDFSNVLMTPLLPYHVFP